MRIIEIKWFGKDDSYNSTEFISEETIKDIYIGKYTQTATLEVTKKKEFKELIKVEVR